MGSQWRAVGLSLRVGVMCLISLRVGAMTMYIGAGYVGLYYVQDYSVFCEGGKWKNLEVSKGLSYMTSGNEDVGKNDGRTET